MTSNLYSFITCFCLQFVSFWAVRIITSSCVTCFQSLGISGHGLVKDLVIHQVHVWICLEFEGVQSGLRSHSSQSSLGEQTCHL